MPALKNAKYERFCRAYVTNHNAGDAAQAIGTPARSARQSGHRLLQRPEIAARIAELDKKLLDKADITAERVMLELGRLAFADVRGLYDESGRLRAVHELDDDVAATIAGIEVDTVETSGGKGKPTTTVRTAKVKRFEKAGALKVLAQHFKIVGNEIDEAVSAALAIAERMEKARARVKAMRKKG